MHQAQHAVGDRHAAKPPAFDDDVWELYDTPRTGRRRTTCAKENPEKLKELQRLFLIEAAKYNVLPLDDRMSSASYPDIAAARR